MGGCCVDDRRSKKRDYEMSKSPIIIDSNYPSNKQNKNIEMELKETERIERENQLRKQREEIYIRKQREREEEMELIKKEKWK